ncbi:MAG: hypothetical protein IJ802_01815 [Kiritimatiellae bacterium]|nr:hypothetical protein [Kiritimatiellia bacterium]
MTNHITVAVEDKANVAFEVEQAIGIMGVFVLVSIMNFVEKRARRLCKERWKCKFPVLKIHR